MAPEGPRGSKLAELVANHVLRHINRHMLAPVVNGKGVADEVRENSGAAAPSFLDDLLSCFVHFMDSLEQLRLYERALFHASAHNS